MSSEYDSNSDDEGNNNEQMEPHEPFKYDYYLSVPPT